ncbi:hypothetical protein GA0061105_10817 [Rhizobium aethiopicum]|uniref:Uncharacterized protein n=1 Tax=Rhizobium aethiopicum TaxID=1138170 RepID=A0A1C3Y5A1_9HYPH|nr:hypothetical protein GA0061105_10817 [Rhizobium aethiopicum]
MGVQALGAELAVETLNVAVVGLKCYPILGQRELEFSGVKAQLGGGADEPFMSEIGTLLPIALCGRNSL